MSWCFEDETTEYAESVLGSLRDVSAAVPALWPLEVANVLLVGERRGRISHSKAASFVRVLRELPISVDAEPVTAEPVLHLGREYGLTAYDAAYLELAVRTGLPLATLDVRLSEAARRAGVPLVE